MEEEKDQEELKRWKELLASHPDEARLKEIPKQVAELLAKDPEVAPDIAEAISSGLPEGERLVKPDPLLQRWGLQPDAALDEAPAEPGAGVEEVQAEASEAAARRESAVQAAMRARKEREEREQKEEQLKKLSLLAQIAKLDVGEKSKLARTGDKDARSILIKDANKQVSMAVLANPRMTIQEIEIIAASRNVGEDILREIGGSRDWCKSYTVIFSLVANPKTPIGVGLTHLPKLLLRDLRTIAKSKGIPDAIRMTAKKFVQKKSL